MNYAVIQNDVITNVIYLSSANAHEFPDAVNVDQYPVDIGDNYIDGKFFRNGEEVLTYDEYKEQTAQARLLEEMDEAYREGVNAV
jgi:hypothetical protein